MVDSTTIQISLPGQAYSSRSDKTTANAKIQARTVSRFLGKLTTASQPIFSAPPFLSALAGRHEQSPQPEWAEIRCDNDYLTTSTGGTARWAGAVDILEWSPTCSKPQSIWVHQSGWGGRGAISQRQCGKSNPGTQDS